MDFSSSFVKKSSGKYILTLNINIESNNEVAYDFYLFKSNTSHILKLNNSKKIRVNMMLGGNNINEIDTLSFKQEIVELNSKKLLYVNEIVNLLSEDKINYIHLN